MKDSGRPWFTKGSVMGSIHESYERNLREIEYVWRYLSGRSRGQIMNIVRSDRHASTMWMMMKDFEKSQNAPAVNDEQLLKECFRDDEHGFRVLQVTYLHDDLESRFQVNDWSSVVEVPEDIEDRAEKIEALKRKMLFNVKYFQLCLECRLRYQAGKMWCQSLCLPCREKRGNEMIY